MDKFHTLPKWDRPQNGFFEIFIDHWWVVTRDNEPLFHGKDNFPQCNISEKITAGLLLGTWYKSCSHRIKQLPVVYRPTNHEIKCRQSVVT